MSASPAADPGVARSRRERATGAAIAALGVGAVGCAAFVPIGKAPFNLFLGIGALAALVVWTLDPARLRASLREPVVLGALGFAALYAASLAWTRGDPAHAREQLGSYRVLLMPLLFAPVLVDRRWRDATLAALLVSLGLVLGLSLVQAAYPLPFARPPTEHDPQGAIVFTDRIRQAIHLSLLGLWAGGTALLERVPPARRGALALLVLVVAVDVLLLVRGRTAWLTVPSVAAYLVALRFGVRGALACAALFAALALSAWAVWPSLATRFAETANDAAAWRAGTADAGSPTGQRLTMWWLALRMIADSPWIGHGIESYRALSGEWLGRSGLAMAEVYHDPHNELLYVAVELGLVGVVAWLAALAALWRVAGRFDDRWRWLARGAVVLYVSAGLANGVLNVGWTGYLFGLLLALVAGRHLQSTTGRALR